jgi:hypothetical protein
MAIDWLPEDVARLKRWINTPYQKLGQATGDAFIELSELEQTAIAMPATSWMPVEWVRDASGQKIPPVVGVALTIAALVTVTVLKVPLWNKAHPDAFIAIPFITRKEAQRGASTQSRTAAGAAAGGGGGSERFGGGGDRGEDVGAAESAPIAGAVDGGPPADTVDDIRRRYGS